MPPRAPNEAGTAKAAISVAEMAKMVGFSRNHFWSLCKAGIFPMPLYAVRTHRPYFTTDLQEVCLTIRRTNVALSGEYVIFNQPRSAASATDAAGGPAGGRSRKRERLARLAVSLGQLGLSVNADQVHAAVGQAFPGGLPEDDGQVIRRLFQHFRLHNSR
jgi:hypothetical protein